jgi:hypothetical protein
MRLAGENVAPQETFQPILMIIIKKNKGINPIYSGSRTQRQDDVCDLMKKWRALSGNQDRYYLYN